MIGSVFGEHEIYEEYLQKLCFVFIKMINNGCRDIFIVKINKICRLPSLECFKVLKQHDDYFTGKVDRLG